MGIIHQMLNSWGLRMGIDPHNTPMMNTHMEIASRLIVIFMRLDPTHPVLSLRRVLEGHRKARAGRRLPFREEGEGVHSLPLGLGMGWRTGV